MNGRIKEKKSSNIAIYIYDSGSPIVVILVQMSGWKVCWEVLFPDLVAGCSRYGIFSV